MAAIVMIAGGASFAVDEDYNGAPIHYASTPPHDAVANLQQRIAAGKAALQYEPEHGYLKSLLKALDVPIDSQSLVFSKTSFQIRHISPASPRAIYFNDDVYVGWVQHGDAIEIADVDPKLGAVFYTLDQHNRKAPVFTRQFGNCLECHAGPMTQSVPGFMVRSVTTDNEGFVRLSAGSIVVTDRTPFDQRFGGWYVTGQHGEMRHMGNVTLPLRDADSAANSGADPKLDTQAGANVTNLSDRVNLKPYLSPQSDLIAQMVLAHQAQMHNLITRASYQTQIALQQQTEINKLLGRPTDQITPQTEQRIGRAVETLLRYMLLVDEPVFDHPISGTSGFADRFDKLGPFDAEGRSLRQLDLHKYLFKYPCSFVIYSPAFDAMPGELRDRVYHRLYDILTHQDRRPPFDVISQRKGRAVLEILRQTKRTLPSYFFADPPGDHDHPAEAKNAAP